MNKFFSVKKRSSGFTLIELLIVIAVLGTLAVVVLIALNPIQQLARARDAGRLSTVEQLGRSMSSRGTTLGGRYPDAPASNWVTSLLVDSGEINTVPGEVQYIVAGTQAPNCTGGSAENGFCYRVNADNDSFVIYTSVEADPNTSRCAAGESAYYVYGSDDGRAGLVCTSGAEPAPGAQTFVD